MSADLALMLRTSRLILATPGREDAAETAAALTPEISRRLLSWKWPMSLGEAEARVEASRRAVAAGEALHFVLRTAGKRDFVGWTSLWRTETPGRWRIGYWLDEIHQGRGLAREATACALAAAVRLKSPALVDAVVQPDNYRSIAVLDHLGLRQVGAVHLLVACTGLEELHLLFERPIGAGDQPPDRG